MQTPLSVVTGHMRLNGANIRRNLDLRGTLFESTTAETDAPIPLFADGPMVGGNALLSEEFSAVGEVRLNGCNITRNLDLTAATLQARADEDSDRILSLSAANGRVSGGLYMRRAPDWSRSRGVPFQAQGTIRLNGTQIAGELNCEGGRFTSPVASKMSNATGDDPHRYAIEADGLSVGGDAFLDDGFERHGEIHFPNAGFGGDFNCINGRFDHPGATALSLDGAYVAGTAFFGTCSEEKPSQANALRASVMGTIRLVYSSTKYGLDLRGCSFGAGSGLEAHHAALGGGFNIKNIHLLEGSAQPGICVNLSQAKADVLNDSETSWQHVRAADFTGFEYAAITDLGPDEHWRLDKLDACYSGSTSFQPQPYLWLARINQQAGYDAMATKIRIRLEKNRTRYGDYKFLKWIGRRILGGTIGYGYRPSYAILWLLAWSVICMAAFWDLPNSGLAVRTKPTAENMVEFNPFIYAVDTVIPIVDLHQKSQWTIQPPRWSPWGAAVRALINSPQHFPAQFCHAVALSIAPVLGVVNPFIGWALTTLFAAGVSGLVRRG